MRMYVDEDDVLLAGRFEGETLQDVADEEPSYLERVLETADLTFEERDQIQAALDAVQDDDEGG